jgi:hypothetical protein
MGNDVFAADAEGWRRMNSGRPAHELLREAVQNAFDEDGCTKVEVKLEHAGGGVDFSITDDVPDGIRDERLIWTIWLSDKADSPTKRGRMGRGLKELISVADWSLIISAGCPAIEFRRHRGKWSRTCPRKVRPKWGTFIGGRVKSWGKSDAAVAVEYLRRVRPPRGIAFSVNGHLVEREEPVEAYALKLPTVLFEQLGSGECVQREPRRSTTVELLAEAHSWIYEMGIPVERIDYPLSIDVGQRVPLREKRDTLTESYRRELFAKLLDVRRAAGLIDVDQLRDDHVLLAARAPEYLSGETKLAIASAWTNGMPYASTSEVVSQATGHHIEVASLRKLPEGVRAIVREVGTDAREVMSAMAVAATGIIDAGDPAHTDDHARLTAIWEWIAAGIDRPCAVRCASGKPSASASFCRETRVLMVYVECASGVAADPLSAESLSLLIHELAHWRSQENEHGMGFHSDAEYVGGAVAAFLFGHVEEARRKNGWSGE